MLQDLDHTEDTPNEAEICLWTHGDDKEDDETVCVMLDAPEDAEEPEDTEEDLEDTRHLYRMVTSGPYD